MARALKVYRTPIGFHDAYVAATSQAAALKAWGTDHDLFTRGAAELVTDPALTAAPLAKPGTIVKLLRGSRDEQMAALASSASPRPPKARPAPRKPAPRPSRLALESAEEAVAAQEKARAEEAEALLNRIAELEQQRRARDAVHDAALVTLRTARDDAQAAYDSAMNKWRRDAS